MLTWNPLNYAFSIWKQRSSVATSSVTASSITTTLFAIIQIERYDYIHLAGEVPSKAEENEEDILLVAVEDESYIIDSEAFVNALEETYAFYMENLSDEEADEGFPKTIGFQRTQIIISDMTDTMAEEGDDEEIEMREGVVEDTGAGYQILRSSDPNTNPNPNPNPDEDTSYHLFITYSPDEEEMNQHFGEGWREKYTYAVFTDGKASFSFTLPCHRPGGWKDSFFHGHGHGFCAGKSFSSSGGFARNGNHRAGQKGRRVSGITAAGFLASNASRLSRNCPRGTSGLLRYGRSTHGTLRRSRYRGYARPDF